MNQPTDEQPTQDQPDESPSFDTPRYRQFAAEATAAGYSVARYRGRFWYDGPAVSIEADELQQLIRATTVDLQWDELGKTGLIVYPR